MSSKKVRRQRPAKAALAPVALGGEIVKEAGLPSPWVAYPRHYGAFHLFADLREGPYRLCSCGRGAAENLLRLLEICIHADHIGDAEYERQRIWSHLVPPMIAEEIPRDLSDLDKLAWAERRCHRCCLVPPALRWSHEMYAGQFQQSFGWYVRQVKLRLGISTHYDVVLEDRLPPEIRTLREDARATAAAFREEEARILAIVDGPDRPDIGADEVTYWHNVRDEEAEEMVRRRRAASKARAAFENAVENIARTEFGHRKVGEGWVSETQLWQVVCVLYPGDNIVRHFRPDWLDGLELDIWLPERRLALEYQGQQHFHPIEVWGGRGALMMLQERDARKAKLCSELGVRLVCIDYTEPLTVEHVTHRLRGEE